MDMAVDEAGNEKRAAEVDGGAGNGPGRGDRDDRPVFDGEVDAASIGEQRVGDDVRPLKPARARPLVQGMSRTRRAATNR